MRTLLLVAVVLVACNRADSPPADTAMADTGAATATLTATDVEGTWTGQSMAEGSDSVVSRWTIGGTGAEGWMVAEGQPDTVRYTTTFDGDSLIAVSQPYTFNGQQVTFRSIGRLQGTGRMAGTATVMPADRPDTTVMRVRWEATRNP